MYTYVCTVTTKLAGWLSISVLSLWHASPHSRAQVLTLSAVTLCLRVCVCVQVLTLQLCRSCRSLRDKHSQALLDISSSHVQLTERLLETPRSRIQSPQKQGDTATSASAQPERLVPSGAMVHRSAPQPQVSCGI